MDYSDYIAENVDSSIAYSEYLAENLDNNIAYAEYIAENMDENNEETPEMKAERIRVLRKKKLKRILKDEKNS